MRNGIYSNVANFEFIIEMQKWSEGHVSSGFFILKLCYQVISGEPTLKDFILFLKKIQKRGCFSKQCVIV